MKVTRSSGILLHPTSLPGKYGIGCFGSEAFAFVDFLCEARQKLWQILPLGPTGPGDSPYQSFSAFALNPLLIDIQSFAEKKYLTELDIKEAKTENTGKVDYAFVNDARRLLFRKAFDTFQHKASLKDKTSFEIYYNSNKFWLENYALFMAIKDYFGGIAWHQWPDAIKKRNSTSMRFFRKLLSSDIKYHCFLQYSAYWQWMDLKEYANRKSIKIIGDIPLYISFDSADAWSNPDLFLLDKKMHPVKVAGVPPDFFSETGQLWGNPVYNWAYQQKTGFRWWIQRMNYNLQLADIVRIDHFRGLAAYWAIPFGAKDAINGEWLPAPGEALFKALIKKTGSLPVIAEDLGVITPDVDELRNKFEFPGMKILQFGFDNSEANPYLPHLFSANSAVYTGTHDNDTVIGWYHQMNETDKQKFLDYTSCNGMEVNWKMIQLAMASVSDYAIVPLQDILGLDSEARTNIPGTPHGNWQWRFREADLQTAHADRLCLFSKLYNR